MAKIEESIRKEIMLGNGKMMSEKCSARGDAENWPAAHGGKKQVLLKARLSHNNKDVIKNIATEFGGVRVQEGEYNKKKESRERMIKSGINN
jgi:hypothetical protein